jgi:glycosyltransferase involved in cell wall biosynthesis
VADIYNILTGKVETKPKIKILFTIPNFDTAGSGKAMLNIASGLNRELFEPHIACFHNRGDFFKVVEASGIPVHIFSFTTNMQNKFRGMLKCFSISREFRKIRADIVHSFHYSDDYSEAIAVRMAGSKYVFTKKNMNWGGMTWKLRSWFANGIITINRQAVSLFFKDSKKPVRAIYRGIDTDLYREDPASAISAAGLGISPGSRIVITVSNLVALKGVDHLVEAMDQLRSKHPRAVLLIVGDDRSDYAAQLKANIEARGMSGMVFFTGKKMNVKEYLQIAHIFVFPSLREAFGVALTEAMAMGKYVLGSDTGGISEQLSEFPELLFTPGNVPILTEKLDQALLMNDDELKSYGRRLRDEVEKRFSLKVEVTNHEKFYLELSGRKQF